MQVAFKQAVVIAQHIPLCYTRERKRALASRVLELLLEGLKCQ